MSYFNLQTDRQDRQPCSRTITDSLELVAGNQYAFPHVTLAGPSALTNSPGTNPA